MFTFKHTLYLTFSFLVLFTFKAKAQGNYHAGFDAGIANNGGSYNDFVGYKAGNKNINGHYNSFFGSFADWNNTIGSYNSFIGAFAGHLNSTGSYNNFLGFNAGYSNDNGSYNTFRGNTAGLANNTGSRNSFYGSDAGISNTIGIDNTYIGVSAGHESTAGLRNTIIGDAAGYATTTGNNNSFLGSYAGLGNTTGSNNAAIGYLAGPKTGNLTNATAIGNRAQVSGSNALVLGSIKNVNGATANTFVGIGVTAPTHQLQLSTDDAAKPGTSTWKVASDKRLKKDITSFTDGMVVLNKIKPVWFQYTGEAGMPTDSKYVGIIAQEMEKVAPYTIGKFTHQDSTGRQTEYLNYDAGALNYILVNAVKEQHARLGEQQKQLEEKSAENLAIKAELADMKTQMSQLAARLESLAIPKADKGSKSAEEVAKGQLYQNAPNPADGTTEISFFIPDGATTAQIKLLNLAGQVMQQFNLQERGQGKLTISTGQFPAGTYVYHLLVDGKAEGAKKMVITK